MSQRDYSIRQQPRAKATSLSYPYYFLKAYPNESPIIQMLGDAPPSFPECVSHYFWIQEGDDEGKPWCALFKCSDGRYGFYKAECDFVDFYCRGEMLLYLSDSFQVIIDKALSKEDYMNYIQKTIQT